MSNSRSIDDDLDDNRSHKLSSHTLSIFSDENFDPDKFSRERFVSKQVAEVRDEYNSLLKEKDRAAEAMQTNVFQNFNKFITTSKEIGNLEADMLELRNQLTDLNSAMRGLQQLSIQFDQDRFLPSAASNSRRVQSFIAKDVSTLLDLPDKLDVCLSQRQFDKAVSQIEAGNKLIKQNSQIESLIATTVKPEIDRRVELLIQSLTMELTSPTIKSSESRRLIGFLQRLGMTDKARAIYLDMRSKRIEREIKKLRLEGDLTLYISDLARLVFSSINTTCEDFCASFGQHQMISGFIVWAISELEKFGTIVKNQVFSNSDDFTIMGKCLEIAKLHCSILEEKGLALTFVLTQMFQPNLVEAIESYKRKLEVNLSNQVLREQWHSTKTFFDKHTMVAIPASSVSSNTSTTTSNAIQLTESAKYLYTSSQQFVTNISRIITIELVPTIASALSSLFESYVTQLANQFSHDLTDNQSLSIIANSHYVVEDLVPRMIGSLEGKLNRPVRDFEKLRKNLQELNHRLVDNYCRKRAEVILQKNIEWDRADFSEKLIEDKAVVSPKFIKLFVLLANLRSLIVSLINQRNAQPILKNVVQEICLQLLQSKNWSEISLEVGGLQQLKLDMMFLLEAGRDILTEKASNAINDIQDKSIAAYCKKTKKDYDDVLKPEDWFVSRVTKAISQNSKEMGLSKGH